MKISCWMMEKSSPGNENGDSFRYTVSYSTCNYVYFTLHTGMEIRFPMLKVWSIPGFSRSFICRCVWWNGSNRNATGVLFQSRTSISSRSVFQAGFTSETAGKKCCPLIQSQKPTHTSLISIKLHVKYEMLTLEMANDLGNLVTGAKNKKTKNKKQSWMCFK